MVTTEAEALRLARQLLPDIVPMDLLIPIMMVLQRRQHYTPRLASLAIAIANQAAREHVFRFNFRFLLEDETHDLAGINGVW